MRVLSALWSWLASAAALCGCMVLVVLPKQQVAKKISFVI